MNDDNTHQYCDDGGRCWHYCEGGECFRRQHCSPMTISGQWPVQLGTVKRWSIIHAARYINGKCQEEIDERFSSFLGPIMVADEDYNRLKRELERVTLERDILVEKVSELQGQPKDKEE